MAPVGPALRQQTPWQTRRPRRCCCARLASRMWTTRPWTVRQNRRQIRSAVGGGTGANVVQRRPADVDLRRRTGTAAVNRGPVAWPVRPAARLGRGWHSGRAAAHRPGHRVGRTARRHLRLRAICHPPARAAHAWDGLSSQWCWLARSARRSRSTWSRSAAATTQSVTAWRRRCASHARAGTLAMLACRNDRL